MSVKARGGAALSALGKPNDGPVHFGYDEHFFHDIDEFRAHFSTMEIEPIQLSRGTLDLGFASLVLEDVTITRLDCNRKVSDRVHMDPSWLLIVVLLAPQRWGPHVAPAGSLVVVAPATEYRNCVLEGFRCVEAAIRLDLVDELGFAPLCQLKGAEAIIPITAATARCAEGRVERLLCASATHRPLAIGSGTAASLHEGCLDFLGFLWNAALAMSRGRAHPARADGHARFALVEHALQMIETAPAQRPPSVETLAAGLSTTRRTLRNAFQEILGTSASRYMLARRLNEARRSLRWGESPRVTDAALDYGFEHFGRFAYHYRSLFGETPSTTLLRARRNRSAALSRYVHYQKHWGSQSSLHRPAKLPNRDGAVIT